MYKVFQNKKYYLAFNTFPKSAKNRDVSWHNNLYKSGIRCWKSFEMYNYSIVIYTFRVIFGVKLNIGSCCDK